MLESDVLGEQSCGMETDIVWISPVDIIYVPFCILVMHFIGASIVGLNNLLLSKS